MERAQSNCHDLRNWTYVNKLSKSQDAEMDYSDQRGPVLVLLLQTFHNFEAHMARPRSTDAEIAISCPCPQQRTSLTRNIFSPRQVVKALTETISSYLSSNFHKISRNSYNWAYYDWHWLDFSWLAVICETLTGPRRWVSATKRACLQKQVCSRVVAHSTGRVRHRLATRYAMVYMMSHDESRWVMTSHDESWWSWVRTEELGLHTFILVYY